MTWGEGKTLPPALTDPVVVDGTKFRIRSIDDGLARCRKSFRGGPDADFEWVNVFLDTLRWDKVASVWRVHA